MPSPSARHDPDDIRRLLEVRQSEKLTYDQLSKRSGVPVHVLAHRAARDRRSRKAGLTMPPGFVEVVAAPTIASEDGRSSGIELVLSRGVRVILDRHFDEVALSRLLSVVRC